MKIQPQLEKTLQASRTLLLIPENTIRNTLEMLASATCRETEFLLEENRKDLERMNPDDPKYDRLKLTEERLEAIAGDIRNVASLPCPVGRVLSKTLRPNGLEIVKTAVPFGVIGIIYEARPNVTFDVFSLCLKSNNACV